MKLVNESVIELTPEEISSKTGVNRSTARKYCRILLKDGDILQPYPSAYCSKSVHGVRFVPLTFHNVDLSVSAPWLDFSERHVEICGCVKMRVLYGIDRRRITGFISSDNGMNKDTVLLILQRFIDVVQARTEKPVENLVIKTLEANRDYYGVRLDCPMCVTKTGLFGVIERIYQKEQDVVRHEFKISKPMSLDEFSALVQGGASAYNLQQGLFMVVQKVESLTEAIEFQNGVLKAMFDKKQKGG
jgi:hypothetical protein